MRIRILALVGLLVATTAGEALAQRQMRLLASVVDANGAVTQSLTPADIRVVENDADAKVLSVEPVDRTVKVQVLLDNGIGLGSENLQHLRTGVRGLLEALPEGMEVTLVSTAPQPRFVERATTDREKLLAAVDRITPDSGAGRFVESLNEATQRIEREKGDTFTILIAAATTSGDADVRERDVQRMFERLQKFPTRVHVVLLTSIGRSTGGGVVQTEVGMAATKMTGGIYENINASSRLASLLPEIGAEVAKTAAQQSRQYRITVERPAGATGDIGRVSMGVMGGRAVTSLTLE